MDCLCAWCLSSCLSVSSTMGILTPTHSHVHAHAHALNEPAFLRRRDKEFNFIDSLTSTLELSPALSRSPGRGTHGRARSLGGHRRKKSIGGMFVSVLRAWLRVYVDRILLCPCEHTSLHTRESCMPYAHSLIFAHHLHVCTHRNALEREGEGQTSFFDRMAEPESRSAGQDSFTEGGLGDGASVSAARIHPQIQQRTHGKPGGDEDCAN